MRRFVFNCSMIAVMFLAGCASSVANSGGDALVKTKQGVLQGGVSDGIYMYFGVPYAQAAERFVPARKAKPWSGVRNATEYGAISLQSSASGFPAPSGAMDNDCQNLNIWTPGIDDKKRAVMVWLHGGGFSSGSAQGSPAYNGENLSRKGDVVVVSVNHRLNIMGHLDLSAYGDKYKYSANVGMLDIVDSLEWIQDNIERFGGDPKNVTVFGESGGGAKVLALMTSPYAKGLFHKGIVQSGATESMGVNFTTLEASRRLGELTLANLGLTENTIEAIQDIPYERLVEETQKAKITTAGEFGLVAALSRQVSMDWEPVVDGDFMPTNPVTADSFAAAGKAIPLLIGTNLNEWTSMGLLMGADRGKILSDADIEALLLTAYGDKKEIVAEEFLKAYPSKTRRDAPYLDTFLRLPILKIMTHKADQGGAPVYAYVFTYGSPMAFHTAEIPYVFNNVNAAPSGLGNSARSEADNIAAERVAGAMSDAWISFAKTGIPSSASIPVWEPYTRSDGATMILDTDSELSYGHDRNLLRILAPEYTW